MLSPCNEMHGVCYRCGCLFLRRQTRCIGRLLIVEVVHTTGCSCGNRSCCFKDAPFEPWAEGISCVKILFPVSLAFLIEAAHGGCIR